MEGHLQTLILKIVWIFKGQLEQGSFSEKDDSPF